MDKAKPFAIPKREVQEAFKRVKANQGAAGVDGQSTAEFEVNLSGNLYRLWNRLSSGSYFPPPVKGVEIPKANGGVRPLGIPTVADRIAQEVARRYLEPLVEPLFHADSDLKRNLYKVWNRMSSGSYHPPPVRLVEIEKDNGGTRPLGIPTIADRVAQTVAKMVLEPTVEPQFHADSYGYRPGRSALDAVGVARRRCWKYNWVIDLDIKAFLDPAAYCTPAFSELSE